MRQLPDIKWTPTELLKKGIPAVLIPGILVALSLGWNGGVLNNNIKYQDITDIFPHSGTVVKVYDGDTFQLNTGQEVRLLGINAPERGKQNYTTATEALSSEILHKTVFLEYDRYQDDKYGRLLSWVWIDCEGNPTFLSADYMHDTANHSKPGLTENPKHCKEGTLVNEYMVQTDNAETVGYKDRGELKYQQRISK